MYFCFGFTYTTHRHTQRTKYYNYVIIIIIKNITEKLAIFVFFLINLNIQNWDNKNWIQVWVKKKIWNITIDVLCVATKIEKTDKKK